MRAARGATGIDDAHRAGTVPRPRFEAPSCGAVDANTWNQVDLADLFEIVRCVRCARLKQKSDREWWAAGCLLPAAARGDELSCSCSPKARPVTIAARSSCFRGSQSVRARQLIADRGYDSACFREALAARHHTLHSINAKPKAADPARRPALLPAPPHRDHVRQDQGLAPHRHALRPLRTHLHQRHRPRRNRHLLAQSARPPSLIITRTRLPPCRSQRVCRRLTRREHCAMTLRSVRRSMRRHSPFALGRPS
jgi:hypothetical protein